MPAVAEPVGHIIVTQYEDPNAVRTNVLSVTTRFGTPLPPWAPASRCTRTAASDGACTTYRCAGYLDPHELDIVPHAGVLDVEVEEVATGKVTREVSLEPRYDASPVNAYPGAATSIPALFAPRDLVRVSARNAPGVTPFELSAPFPPSPIRFVLPGQASTDDPNERMWGGAIKASEDLAVETLPATTDAAFDVLVIGTHADVPADAPCTAQNSACASVTFCSFPEGAPIRLPRSAFTSIQPKSIVRVALAAVKRAQTRAGKLDIDLTTLGSTATIDYQLQ